MSDPIEERSPCAESAARRPAAFIVRSAESPNAGAHIEGAANDVARIAGTLFVVPPERVDSDERFTPRWLFDALGESFDLDPASPVGGGDHVPATTKYTRRDDGLVRPWTGFVWCNPPFSSSTQWAERFRAHGCGLWLGPVANSRWFIELTGVASRIWLMRDFAFDHPTHAGRRSSMPLGMIAMGDRAAQAIDRAADALGPAAGTVVARFDGYPATD